MIFLAVLVQAVALLALFVGGDKPTELDADVWDADAETCARNLKLKIEARKAGKPYMNPAAAAKIEADCAAAKARPFRADDFKAAPREEGPRRLVRRHPMRPATWE